jgi:HNH endonuclease
MLTQLELKKHLNYDQETGIFTWVSPTAQCKKIGDIAGSLDCSCGYIKIALFNKDYKAHRLAWFYMHGFFPDEIDHNNHNKTDNRLINLTAVTRKQNTKNRAMNKNNRSGIQGVCWVFKRQRWCAFISINGSPKTLGYFKTRGQAEKIRKSAEEKYGFHVNHGKKIIETRVAS